MRPRMALSAVVLPAPLGPIRPRMRPSLTVKSTPSSAMVVPKALRRPRASMHAMISTLLLSWTGRRSAVVASVQQFFRFQTEPLNGGVNSGPFLGKKLLPLALQQQIARAGIDKHAAAAPGFDQTLVHQLLIALQNRERIHAIIGRDSAHGGQGIAFLEHAIEYHRDHTIAKLAVNRLIVVPLTVHPGFSKSLLTRYAGCNENFVLVNLLTPDFPYPAGISRAKRLAS